jgi:hypothetical protein
MEDDIDAYELYIGDDTISTYLREVKYEKVGIKQKRRTELTMELTFSMEQSPC